VPLVPDEQCRPPDEESLEGESRPGDNRVRKGGGDAGVINAALEGHPDVCGEDDDQGHDHADRCSGSPGRDEERKAEPDFHDPADVDEESFGGEDRRDQRFVRVGVDEVIGARSGHEQGECLEDPPENGPFLDANCIAAVCSFETPRIAARRVPGASMPSGRNRGVGFPASRVVTSCGK
jgi:hypothetical protein